MKEEKYSALKNAYKSIICFPTVIYNMYAPNGS